MSRQLQDSTRRQYASYVGKFVFYIAKRNPELLCDELYEALNESVNVNFYKKKAGSFICASLVQRRR